MTVFWGEKTPVSSLGRLSVLRSSMFALQTRSAHLLLQMSTGHSRCALTASQSSVGGYKSRRGTHRMPLLIITRTRVCVFLITMQCRACGGRICNATERSPERQQRARLPLSGTVLLQKRNMKRNRRTAGMSGGQSKE